MVTSQTYNDFKEELPLPADASAEEIKEIRLRAKRLANRKRSFANKHLKAWLRGKSSVRAGTKMENNIRVPNIINIQSSEQRIFRPNS
jgi:hypothetical protein